MSGTPDEGAAADSRRATLERLWQRVNDELRRGPVNRGLWDAAAAARPIAVDSGVLVLGVAPEDRRHIGYL